MSRKNCPWYTLYHCCSHLIPKALLLQILFYKEKGHEKTSIAGQICASPLPFSLSHHPIYGGVKISAGSVHKWMVVKTPEWPQWQLWGVSVISCNHRCSDVSYKKLEGQIVSDLSPLICYLQKDCCLLLYFTKFTRKGQQILYGWLLQLRVWDKVLFSPPSVYIYRYIPFFDLLMINIQRILRS